MVMGIIGGSNDITQTTISVNDNSPTVLTISQDDLSPNATGVYSIQYVERYEEFIDIPDDEPVETILLIAKTKRGYLKIPIKWLRKSMHPG